MQTTNGETSPLATTGPFEVSTYESSELLSCEHIAKNGFSLRTTLVSVGQRNVLVYNPARGLVSRDWQPWLGDRRIRYVLSPNFFHHMGFNVWHERYPDATMLASEVAAARVRKKACCSVDVFTPEVLRGTDAVQALIPPGVRTGETWLRIQGDGGVTWLVGDAFFSMPTTPKGVFGLVCELTGTTPGLRIGHTYVRLALRDKRAYGRWLVQQIERDRPRTLITCHGDIVRVPSLADRLLELAATRLGA